MSDLFNVAIGLKQGEPLSPLMFILFENDISNIVDFNNLTDLDIAQLSLYLLIFADDIAVFLQPINKGYSDFLITCILIRITGG